MKMSDLHWVAGFLEGEGSFSFKSSLALTASQVQLQPLQRLQSLFGGAIFTEKRVQKRSTQICSAWYLYGYRAAGLMMTLCPLMSPRRQEQIRLSLAIWRTKKIANGQRMACPKGHPYSQSSRPGRCRYCSICSAEAHHRWHVENYIWITS